MRISQSMGITSPLSVKKQVSQSERNADSGNLMQSNPMARPSAKLLAARAGVRFTGHSEDLQKLWDLSIGTHGHGGLLEEAKEIRLIVERLNPKEQVVANNATSCMSCLDKIIQGNDTSYYSYSVCNAKRSFIDSSYSVSEGTPRTPQERLAATYKSVRNALQAQLELKTAQKKWIEHFPHLKEGHEALEEEIADHTSDLAMKPEELKEKYIIQDENFCKLTNYNTHSYNTCNSEALKSLMEVSEAYKSGKLSLTNPNVRKEFDSEFKTAINEEQKKWKSASALISKSLKIFEQQKTGKISTTNKDMIIEIDKLLINPDIGFLRAKEKKSSLTKSNYIASLKTKSKERTLTRPEWMDLLRAEKTFLILPKYKEYLEVRKEFLSTLPEHLKSDKTREEEKKASENISKLENFIEYFKNKKAFYEKKVAEGSGSRRAMPNDPISLYCDNLSKIPHSQRSQVFNEALSMIKTLRGSDLDLADNVDVLEGLNKKMISRIKAAMTSGDNSRTQET